MAALSMARLGAGREVFRRLLLLKGEGRPRRWPLLGAPQMVIGLLRKSQVSAESCSADPKYPGIVESTEEYKYVERLIPPTRVPAPPKHDKYPTPSGWQPPQDPPPNLPFFVRRTRMHNIPVYMLTTHGCRKMTLIRKVEGNIWALEKEVKEFLTQLLGQPPITQVNEVACSIRIKGYFDQELKTWLTDKGF